jgi:SAM-dependent methyltransferase
VASTRGCVTQRVYDRYLRKSDSHDELYDSYYTEYLHKLESLGTAGIEGGGDILSDEEKGAWADKIYVDLHKLLASILARGSSGEGSGQPRHILELGAGSGYLPCKLVGPDIRAHLIDKQAKAVKLCTMVAKLMDKDAYVVSECTDMFDFSPGHSYDLVFSIGVFEELDGPQRQRFLEVALGLTRPSGALLVGVPNFYSPVMVKLWRQYGKGNEIYLSRLELRRLLRGAGCVDVHARGAGSVVSARGDYWADHRLDRWLGMMNVAWGWRP